MIVMMMDKTRSLNASSRFLFMSPSQPGFFDGKSLHPHPTSVFTGVSGVATENS